MKKITLRMAILILCFFPLYAFLIPEKKKEEFYIVKRGEIIHFTEQTGIIKPQVGSIVKVGTRATGTLVKLNYQVGDYVKKGALIAKIDDREIKANMEVVKAQIETLKKNLEIKKIQYAYAFTNYEREKRLLEKDFTTKDKVDLAKRDMDVLKLEIETIEKQIKEAEEKLNALKVSLSYTEIYAPISGYVAEVATQEGETVVAGLSAVNLITIIDPTRLELRIYVDETDIGKVKKGMEVKYWVDAYRDKIFEGKIDMINLQPEIKENIVYYLAIVKIPSKDALLLKPDMTAHVRIIIEKKNNVLLVPNKAISYEGGKFYVYVLGEKGEEKREIRYGIRDEKYSEILSGLRENERVILRGLPLPKKK